MNRNRISLRDRRSWIAKMVIIAICAQLCLSAGPLGACAMSAIIAREDHTVSEFRQRGDAVDFWDFDDPYDYFGFVMSTSLPYLNSDGYGIVAYSENNPILSSRKIWYKRVLSDTDFGNVYYTGQYLRHNYQNAYIPNDVFDDALATIMGGGDRPVIVMCHARNATGTTLGNHPFRFEFRGRTYSFMHNGYVNAARSYMIGRIYDMHPDLNWFVAHPSNYFEDTDPDSWVDTEVLFHYIMSHIDISGSNDPLPGIVNALRGIADYLLDSRTGVYNFVMSDGSRLYAFRSTPWTGTNSHYKLSYRSFDGQFYGIRTQTPAANDTQIKPRELVVFSRNTKPVHYAVLDPDLFASGEEGDAMVMSRNRGNLNKVSIRITPNPMVSPDGQIVLKISAPTTGYKFSGTVDLYNMRGQHVLRRELGLISGVSLNDLDISGIPNGIYLCRVVIGSYTAGTKITIAR